SAGSDLNTSTAPSPAAAAMPTDGIASPADTIPAMQLTAMNWMSALSFGGFVDGAEDTIGGILSSRSIGRAQRPPIVLSACIRRRGMRTCDRREQTDLRWAGEPDRRVRRVPESGGHVDLGPPVGEEAAGAGAVQVAVGRGG